MTRAYLWSAAALLSASAGAQTNSTELERIVVTASRTPVEIAESGSSLSVITRAEIERRQAVSVVDLLRDVPGIAVNQSGGAGTRAQVRVRGAEANHVLVIIDGVEANDPAAGDEFQFEHLMTDSIERIEIVRGPQSALWGSDAVGGVINIVTQGAGAAGADGFLETGSFDTTRLGGRLGADGDGRRLRLGVSYLDTNGTNIARIGDEEDGYRNGTASLGGHWDLADTVRLELVARHTQASADIDGIDFVETGLPTDADRVTQSTQTYASLAAVHEPTSAWRQSVRLSYLDTDSDELDAGSHLSSLGAEKVGVYYQASVDLATPRSSTLTFAADHERTDYEQRGLATAFGDPNHDQRVDTTGYVLEYRIQPLERLHVSTALRRDANSDFDDATTVRLTGAYALDDGDTRLRASLGTGQKAPTFTDRFGFFPDEFLGNPDLKPERSRGWEIGMDRAISSRRLLLSATYFDEELEDEIDGFVFDPTMNQFTAINLSGTSHRRGLELGVSGELTPALSLSAAYTRIDSTEPGSSGEQTREIRRPERVASLNLSYAATPRLDVNLGLDYNGAQLDTFFPPFPAPPGIVKLSGYALVSLAARFRLSGRLELFGRIENLLDEKYEDVYGFATPGVAAYIGLRTRR
ncbi:MAG TPA: TonB-dependent receptor [Gammaproteobacteria bacterium]|nr:TonB-dependent receptor [Gammaproteobacteria bacterium]